MKSTAVSIRQVRKLRPRGRFIHLRAADLSSGLLDLGACALSTSCVVTGDSELILSENLARHRERPLEYLLPTDC